MASKPVFQRFVEANLAMLDCYHRIPKERLDSMSAGEMDGACAKEKSMVRSILESNEMTMTQLVKDRVDIMYKLNARGPMKTVVVKVDADDN